MLVEADVATRVNPKADSGTPSQTVDISFHRFDVNVSLQSGEVSQLLGYPEFLQSPLGGEADVLEIAPATEIRPGVRTRGFHPVRRRTHDFDGVSPQEFGGLRRHLRHHSLARYGMAHEDHSSIGRMGYASATTSDIAHFELEQCGIEGVGHGRTIGGAANEDGDFGVEAISRR
jgi:hypothetical protein